MAMTAAAAKGPRRRTRRKLLSDEIFQKVDYKNPQVLRVVRHRPRQDDPAPHQRRVGSSAARHLHGDPSRAHARAAAVLGDGRLVMAMQVILTQDVDEPRQGRRARLGPPGLRPQLPRAARLAVTATVRNKNRLDHEKAVIARRVEKERATANEIATRINGMTLQFERQVGEDEKLFGSVTSRDIQEQLKKANVEIDHRWVAARPAGQGARQVRSARPPRGGRRRDAEVLGRR